MSELESGLTNFFSKYPLQRYKKGELIYRPEDSFSQTSFIKTGYVRMYLEDTSGRQITINIFKPVFYFSFIGGIKQETCKYYFESATDVELWKAPIEEVYTYIKSNPNILNGLLLSYASALEKTIDSIKVSLTGESYERIGATLLSLAKQYGIQKGEVVKIDVDTTHSIIASIAGISRETASIQIKKLEREGLIKQGNKTITIVNFSIFKEKFDTDY